MTEPISDELLNAYLDGELSAEELARVESLVENDPAAQDMLRRLAETNAGLRAAYSAPLNEEVPGDLNAAIKRAIAGRNGAGRRAESSRKPWRLPAFGLAAAALTALVLVLVGGLVMLDMTVEQRLAAERAEQKAEKLALEMAIQQALETNTSGASEVWRAPERELAGTTTPVRTFRNTEGRWCREYLQKIDTGSRHETRQGIACRDSDGVWRTRLETFLES